ncbi:MAG: glycosyltransferase, partial [Gammaproteobacteria bacterium]|nr:glycosyltransferase [Gammaproteobacteria bacterium]
MQRNFLVEDQILPLDRFDGTSPSPTVRPILREVKRSPQPAPRTIHVSIVIHRHGWMIRELFEDLSEISTADQIQVTLIENVPETTHYRLDQLPFPVKVIRNETPKGFSANHNAAFRSLPLSEQDIFVVLNPDVRLKGEPFKSMVRYLQSDPTLGVIAPAVVSPKGRLEDSARPVPTFWRLFLKIFGRRGHFKLPVSGGKEYPDWVAGMMMAFRSEVFDKVGGFDENYHLY